jgi:hypothetical protein
MPLAGIPLRGDGAPASTQPATSASWARSWPAPARCSPVDRLARLVPWSDSVVIVTTMNSRQIIKQLEADGWKK